MPAINRDKSRWKDLAPGLRFPKPLIITWSSGHTVYSLVLGMKYTFSDYILVSGFSCPLVLRVACPLSCLPVLESSSPGLPDLRSSFRAFGHFSPTSFDLSISSSAVNVFKTSELLYISLSPLTFRMSSPFFCPPLSSVLKSPGTSSPLFLYIGGTVSFSSGTTTLLQLFMHLWFKQPRA